MIGYFRLSIITKKERNMRYLLIMGLVLGLAAQVCAQSSANGVTTLPDVVVTAEEERFRTATTSSFLVDAETIKNSSAQNLSELLIEQGLAVEATPNDYGENTTLLRGFQTEHLMTEVNGKLLILIDGRRSGVANTRQISLNNVERVEIVRGPEMLKYSLGSPGGVINVITKKGGPERFGGSIYSGFGSYNSWRGGANANGAADGFDYSAGYEYNTVRNNYSDGNGDTVYNTKTDGTHSVFANAGYTFADRHRIGLDAYYYKVDNAERPAYVDDEGVQRGNNYTDRETQLYYINYEGISIDRHWLWNTCIGYGQDNYYTYTGPDSAGRVSYHPKGQETESWRAQGGLTYATNLFDISGGIDYIKYEVSNSSTARGSKVQNIGGWPMHKTSTSSIFGTYLTGTLKLLDGTLNLSGGLRYEYAAAKDKSVGDEYWGDVAYFRSRGLNREDFPTSRNFDHLSPSIGISYLPLDWLKLRANYTQGWRAPSGRQLFASSFYEDYGAPGDPRLKPEKTDAYEVGFDINAKHISLSGTWFYYKVKNNIYIYPGINIAGTGANGRVMMNADERIQTGFEINVSTNVAGLAGFESFELRPYFNITHMTKKEEVLQKGGPGLWGEWWPITRQPDTTMSYGLRFNYPEWKFSANLNFNYYGKQYGGRANIGDGNLSDLAFGKFTVVNLGMRKQLLDLNKYGNMEVKLSINNLFNEKYSYLGKVPDDTYAYQGRNFFVTFIYNF